MTEALIEGYYVLVTREVRHARRARLPSLFSRIRTFKRDQNWCELNEEVASYERNRWTRLFGPTGSPKRRLRLKLKESKEMV